MAQTLTGLAFLASVLATPFRFFRFGLVPSAFEIQGWPLLVGLGTQLWAALDFFLPSWVWPRSLIVQVCATPCRRITGSPLGVWISDSFRQSWPFLLGVEIQGFTQLTPFRVDW